ncbi:MAG: hypothetical protein K1X31_03835 [Gemmatimonadaceae bacterium]|nr:hypothetical protein [Gemmatimonadaceae bacterium]
MAERRFDDDEVSRILARAAEESVQEPPADEATGVGRPGLTLAQLQEIGAQAGIPAARIAAAARALDRPAPAPAPSFLGLALGARDATQLDRRLTDEEWERLVVLLRDTFDARGQVQVIGNLRQWTNGNLQVLVEPGTGGDRVRLRTRNAAAQALLSMGTTFLTTALILVGITQAQGTVDPAIASALVPLVGGGIGTLIAGIVRLRRWAPLRLLQMRRIVERLEAGPLP